MAAKQEVIDLTVSFSERLNMACHEDMDVILIEQEQIVEAHAFVEDLTNNDDDDFFLMNEDELVLPPVFDDADEGVQDLIDEILEDDLMEFNFDMEFAEYLN